MRLRAAFVLTLGMLGVFAAACDPSPGSVALVSSASSFTPGGNFSPNPIPLSLLGGVRCPGGFAFGTSIQLIITAGARNLTLDRVTLHLLDGSNLGGPSVTIPGIDAAGGFGPPFIRAGTTWNFALRPTFGCITGRPRLLRGNAFLFDPFGLAQTIVLEGAVQ